MGENDDISNIKSNIDWQDSVENLLKVWGEQATVYRLLHYRSYYRFRYKTIAITIPVIILQSVCGSASIGLNSLFAPADQHVAQVGVGAVSLLTSMLVTVSNYLQYAELKQAHHHAMVAYGKLARDIRTTLSLYRKDRPDAGSYLATCKHLLDRLTEDSPTIPDDVAKHFKKKYQNSTVAKPDICDTLSEIVVTREKDLSTYLDPQIGRNSSISSILNSGRDLISRHAGVMGGELSNFGDDFSDTDSVSLDKVVEEVAKQSVSGVLDSVLKETLKDEIKEVDTDENVSKENVQKTNSGTNP